MKIHEHFMFGGEFALLNFRSNLYFNDINYSSSLSYLNKTHAGNPLRWDIHQLKAFHFIKTFEIDSNVAKLYYNQYLHLYRDYNLDWVYEIGQRLVSYELLKIYFNDTGYPDILLISDCDEIPLDLSIESLNRIDIDYFRLGMDWRIGDPRYKYEKLWPGTFVIKGAKKIRDMLSDPILPLLIHKTRNYESIKYICGFHLTYFGSYKEFKEKCKSIAERNGKRVILSSIIGPWLLKKQIDPMLRFNLKISKVNSDPRFKILEHCDWN